MRQSFTSNYRCVENDRRIVWKQRQSLLHCKEQSLHISTEAVVKMCLCDRSKGAVLSRSRVCKYDIEFSCFLRNRSIKIVQVIQVADVTPDSFDARPDLLCRIGKLRLGPPGDKDEGSFQNEAFCGCESDAARPSCNECYLSIEFAHNGSFANGVCWSTKVHELPILFVEAEAAFVRY